MLCVFGPKETLSIGILRTTRRFLLPFKPEAAGCPGSGGGMMVAW